ncbi:MAG TPA: L-threonylcarbamoyladenylate synthase [Rhizomicrobium sp.]|jgi:L-threonylcarbamoyladenylate synthase|nr:L-threonylcarbamoyladenylate synthase [Rhizomicrobium sp.]
MTAATLSTLKPATPAAIAEAGEIIRRGGLVAFPTETVYGLGANAEDETAIAGVFAAKGRPRFNPLIVHIRDLPQAETLATFTPLARKLAEQFWPGPLTLVLPRKANAKLALLVSAGLDTVALRVPANATAQDLLTASARPIAAPSANASGTISATTAAHVADSLKDRVDLILDGGATNVGIESTIIGFDDNIATLLRTGAIARETIEAITGPLAASKHGKVSAPGQLESHYAPNAALRLNATTIAADEALLAFGPPLTGAKATLNLSPTSDLKEAAANLFAMLRALDTKATRIAAMPIPETGLGEAINDRLQRAAAPRGTP